MVNGQWSMVNGQWSMVKRLLHQPARARSPKQARGCCLVRVLEMGIQSVRSWVGGFCGHIHCRMPIGLLNPPRQFTD
ncbi:MAG: hypothetical protein HC827_20745 [Cyanobacteria bacterium RM1_2_2]|nr:hypothetical protein [Cyanobacteria bacterium RM1_2_2]